MSVRRKNLFLNEAAGFYGPQDGLFFLSLFSYLKFVAWRLWEQALSCLTSTYESTFLSHNQNGVRKHPDAPLRQHFTFTGNTDHAVFKHFFDIYVYTFDFWALNTPSSTRSRVLRLNSKLRAASCFLIIV